MSKFETNKKTKTEPLYTIFSKFVLSVSSYLILFHMGYLKINLEQQ